MAQSSKRLYALLVRPSAWALVALSLGVPSTGAMAAHDLWTPLGPEATAITSLVIDPATPATIYAGSAHGQVFKSTDGGAHWAATGPALTSDYAVPALAIDRTAPGTVYAASVSSLGGSGDLYQSTDGGAHWSALGPPGYAIYQAIYHLAVDPENPAILYVGATNGLFKSVDAGVTWSVLDTGASSPNGVRALAIDPVTPATVYVATRYCNVIAPIGCAYEFGFSKSTDRGTSWMQLAAPFDDVGALVVDPVTRDTLYAGTPSSGVFKSTDGGQHWAAINTGLTNLSVAALAIDPKTRGVVYAGTSGGVFKSTDGGAHWTPTDDTGVSVEALAIDPETPATVYAGTSDGGAFKSTDAAGHWGAINGGLGAAPVIAVAVDPAAPATLYASTVDGGVFRSTDRGRHWDVIDTGLGDIVDPNGINALVVDPDAPATVYLLAAPGLYRTTNAGSSWNPVIDPRDNSCESTDRALGMHPGNPTIIYRLHVSVSGSCYYSFGSFDTLFRSTDGGATWTDLGDNFLYGAFTSLAFDPVTPTTVYAAYNYYRPGMTRTTDGGAHWDDVSVGLMTSYISALAIDPRNPANLYVGTRDGGVFMTTNGGALWTPSGTPLTNLEIRVLGIDPEIADTIYAGTDHGVFRSTDGAGTWGAVETGAANSQVRALAIDPTNRTTVYAGTDGGVFCLGARCALDAAVGGAACIGQVIPASVTKKIGRVESLIDRGTKSKEKHARRLLKRARSILAEDARQAARAAKGKRPKLSANCATALAAAAKLVRDSLGP